MSKLHSVLLKEDECEGCTQCVQNCPTKAIRVHQGQAWIKEDYCIDCGECIRTCEHHAKYAITDGLEEISQYKYPIVLVPPSFYGQFTSNINLNQIVLGLKELGFKEVWDVALGAEALTQATIKYLREHDGPIISSSCPAVVRLIQLLYPELVDYLAPFKSPVDIMAERVKSNVISKYEATDKEIGVFFITPCPAKMTTVNNPLGIKESHLDGAIAVEKIYSKLIKKVHDITTSRKEINSKIPCFGISWGKSGGEENLLEEFDTLSVSGIHNVMSILEEIERGNLSNIKYFELVSCHPGCVGGVLNVKNPFLGKFNIESLIKEGDKFINQDFNQYNLRVSDFFQANPVKPLDTDLGLAIEKLSKLELEIDYLPSLDCAACGAPNCETLAEDIVNGLANRTDCIFILRQQLAELADEMFSLANEVPPVLRQTKEDKEDNNES